MIMVSYGKQPMRQLDHFRLLGHKYETRKQMQGFISKNRSNARVYYIRQCNRVKSKARIAYKISKKYKLAYSKYFHTRLYTAKM